MLSPKEHKVVIETLTKRKAWIKKTVEDSSLEPGVREDHISTLKLMDSAIQKLANSVSKTTPEQATTKTTQQAPKTASKTVVPINAAKLLIAEDNPDSAKLLLDILLDMGLKNIDVAKNGIDAFEQIKKAPEPYHLILCDWDMPGLSGLDVHSKAKASNTLGNSHFIMVTAVSERTRISQAIQQGVNDYIVKPIDIDVLETKIRTVLNLEQKPLK